MPFRRPSRETLRRRAPAIAGFVFGVALLVLGGMLASVVYTGRGFFLPPPEPESIFPDY